MASPPRRKASYGVNKMSRKRKIVSNSSSLICVFRSSIDHLPLIELTPFVLPQPLLLASIYLVISTFLDVKLLVQSLMFSYHHFISPCDFSLTAIFASKFNLFSLSFGIFNVSKSLQCKGPDITTAYVATIVSKNWVSCLIVIYCFFVIVSSNLIIFFMCSFKVRVTVLEFRAKSRNLNFFVSFSTDFF